ncbi:hypothetical protein [Bradyrhizobium sp. JYMT SZCCT0428]|uniref:hypothetical protein n=1 Tax=Bradyrhizobium sp. JYMT SZCCT0428 TaxID=2807673 RepID=UPI001BA8184A|nr:hypothetical protein [Bradyrhizobium sp. JYMT SZCCT0428]MBR1150069.1 hypothetical protein [Bradyrhizobium sp. JYMT SZCCT0428]
MITGIFEAIKLFGMLKSFGILVAVVAALAIGYGVWRHKVFREGYARALSDIAANDTAAVGRATDLRKTWRECRDRGGRWDQAAGRCGS